MSSKTILNEEQQKRINDIDGRTWQALNLRREEFNDKNFLDTERTIRDIKGKIGNSRDLEADALAKCFDCLTKHLQRIAGVVDAEEEIAAILPAYIETGDKLREIWTARLEYIKAANEPERESYYEDFLQRLAERYDPAVYN